MTAELRVIHVITRLIIGGAQENTVSSVLGLRLKPGISVRLLSGMSSGSEGSLEGLFTEIPGTLSIVPELVRPLHPWKDARALKRLTEIFRESRPHLVHTHSGKAGILGRLAAHRAGVPLIIHTVHGPSFGPFQGRLSNCLFSAAERRAARCTNHFISVADAMTDQYLAAGIGRPEQFTRILSGFELDPFLAAKNDPVVRAKFGISTKDFVLAKLARLAPLKGHEELFAVARRLVERCPSFKFLLIGDGPLRGDFERRITSLGLQGRFVFAGLVRPDEVPALLGISDALVHLSAREGLPRALPQAMAAGKPVVAYAADGAPEVCIDGKTGFLVQPGDRVKLAERLIDLAENRSRGEALGAAGRELVRRRFGLQRMVDDIYELYLKLAVKAGLAERAPLHEIS
jgi:glycosyltransferase involved in cell wall biosynthesis